MTSRSHPGPQPSPPASRTRAITGPLPFRAAHAIVAGLPKVRFDDAYALCRLVLEFDGGPIASRGRRAPLPGPVTTRLRNRGWATWAGEGTVYVAARISSVENLDPAHDAADRWTLRPTGYTVDESLTKHIVVTPEGLNLVQRYVAGLPHPDAPDERENPDHGRRPGETGAITAEVNRPRLLDGQLDATESDVAGVEGDDSAHQVTAPTRDWTAELGPLLPLAAELFNIWTTSCEVQWAGYAMAAVRRAGLPDGDDPAIAVVDLAALSLLAREFFVYAADEGSAGDGLDALARIDLTGPEPLVSPVAAGRLAERHHLEEDVDDAHDIVVQLAASRAQLVADALLRVLGPRETFWSLAWSVEEDAVFPVSDRHDDVEPNLPTPARGYAWVDQGMGL